MGRFPPILFPSSVFLRPRHAPARHKSARRTAATTENSAPTAVRSVPRPVVQLVDDVPVHVWGPRVSEAHNEFEGIAARVTSAEHAAALVKMLRSHKDLHSASHRAIGAFRVRADTDIASESSDVNGQTTQTCDGSWDDGEAGAGRVLLALLEDARREDTAVFVARWFGGRMGPRRFAAIAEAGRGALAALDEVDVISED
eukprot:TRINITY_DN68988_c0_g1_i1.p1 TRINITY_DN68988_c0_g1~~TRINITY_DN68988_c0_g1_i1.p1  ORF type:complete len:200 (+),score=18.01 TRINITY_DN68988_c0_g1_i1:113-712(+)